MVCFFGYDNKKSSLFSDWNGFNQSTFQKRFFREIAFWKYPEIKNHFHKGFSDELSFPFGICLSKRFQMVSPFAAVFFHFLRYFLRLHETAGSNAGGCRFKRRHSRGNHGSRRRFRFCLALRNGPCSFPQTEISPCFHLHFAGTPTTWKQLSAAKF